MGGNPGCRPARANAKKKQYKRKVWLCHRDKDVDQIQDELELEAATGTPVVEQLGLHKFNDDLPGGGQFYCVETAKHFISQRALDDHKRTKFYKRRLKQLKVEKYTQATAEWAAGMTKEILPPVTQRGASIKEGTETMST